MKAKDGLVRLREEAEQGAQGLPERSDGFSRLLSPSAALVRVEQVRHRIVVEKDLVRHIQRYTNDLETTFKDYLRSFWVDEYVELCKSGMSESVRRLISDRLTGSRRS